MVLFLIATLVVFISVTIHYQALRLITHVFTFMSAQHPSRFVIAVFLAVIAHLIEIIIFALGWDFMEMKNMITFSVPSPTFLDLVYFSGTTYTTLGYGDIVILGSGRTIAVVEAVTGLVLITWTASFTFFEMNRYWYTD